MGTQKNARKFRIHSEIDKQEKFNKLPAPRSVEQDTEWESLKEKACQAYEDSLVQEGPRTEEEEKTYQEALAILRKHAF
jgi:hypothetical protein